MSLNLSRFKEENRGLISELTEYYKHNYEKNDDAHGFYHIYEVCDEALKINEKLKLKLDENIIIITVFIHDMFTGIDRKNHHTLASKYVMKKYKKDKYLKELSNADRYWISKAVLEHRASGDMSFTSALSELLYTADKGPLDLDDMIRRSYKYHKNDGTTEVILDAILSHLHEKFGTNGYMVYSDMYIQYYGTEINNLKKEIDKVDINYLKKVLRIM